MSQISIIKKSDVQEARRFDAEFFKPEYLEIEEKLKKIKSKKFENILGKNNVFSGPFGSTLKSESYQKSGIPFIRISDIQDIFIEKTNLVYISEQEHQRLKSTSLNIDDIVLSKIGTIGRMSLITEILGKVNISENNIGLRLRELSIAEKRFVLFFLLSKYGQSQIFRAGSGNVQLKFNVKDIDNLLVPNFKNFNIEFYKNIYNKIIKKQTQSKQLYREAEEALLGEFDLLDYKPKRILSFETRKKKTDRAKRFDAEYFQPRYEEIIKKIEKYKNGWDYIKNMIDWRKGIEVGSEAYQETGKDFIRVSDFSINGIEKTDKKISKEFYQKLKKDFQPKQGEILFTKDGTIGLSYVLKENFEGILSGAFLRLNLKGKYKNFEKECLVLIFNSILSKAQIEKLSGGAVIAHLKPSDFEKIKISLIKSRVQKQIAEKIQESHKLREESKNLLEKAKRKVEQEIENKSGK